MCCWIVLLLLLKLWNFLLCFVLSKWKACGRYHSNFCRILSFTKNMRTINVSKPQLYQSHQMFVVQMKWALYVKTSTTCSTTSERVEKIMIIMVVVVVFGCSLALFLSRLTSIFQLRNENAYQPHKFDEKKTNFLIFETFVLLLSTLILNRLWEETNITPFAANIEFHEIFTFYFERKKSVNFVSQKMAHFNNWDYK